VTDIRDLHSLLQALAEPGSRPEVQQPRLGIRYVDAPPPDYIVPPLTVETEFDEGTAVVMLSAPAATGKSAAARYVAGTVGAPLFDLSTIQVGDGTFAGSVANAFGFSAGTRVLTELESGNGLIVVDALDEAELRAGNRNFNAFLLELCRFARTEPAKPTVLLLARTETADWVDVAFADEGVSLARYSIGFFDRDRAYEFIDAKLRHTAGVQGPPPHTVHVQAFERARELLLDKIYTIFDADPGHAWDDEDVVSFLGYAPVLEALSEYLSVRNYQRLAETLESSSITSPGNGRAQWHFLVRLVEGLLLREQGKFRDNVWPQLAELLEQEWSGENALYTPEEQCERLLSRTLPKVPRPEIPISMPGQIRIAYEEAVTSAIANHPFLGARDGYANVVFRDYVYARTLHDRLLSIQGIQAVRQGMRSTAYLPAPLFGNFLLALNADVERPRVAAQDLGIVLDSLASRLQAHEQMPVFAAGTKKSAGAVIAAVRDGSISETVMELVEPDRGLSFPARLRDASIFFDGPVELGGQGHSFTLGPNVLLSCQELYVITPELAIYSEPEHPVEIVAGSYLGSQNLRIGTYGQGNIRASWEAMEYPWVQYQVEATTPAVHEPLGREFAQLRRIVRRFRDARRGELFIYKELMDNFVLAGNELASFLMKRLLERGLISSDYRFYRLDIQQLDASGLNYTDLRENRLTPSIRQFLSDLLKD